MKVGRIVGSVVCSQLVDSLQGERLLLVQPLDETGQDAGPPVVACDIAQAGPGDTVLFEGGREAAMALRHSFNPSDATVMAVIDDMTRTPDVPSCGTSHPRSTGRIEGTEAAPKGRSIETEGKQ